MAYRKTKINDKQVMNIINILLFWILLSMLIIHDVYGYELYCKIHNTTVMSKFSDGSPDTIAMHLGCTTIKEDQELLKIEFKPVKDSDFKRLFVEQ